MTTVFVLAHDDRYYEMGDNYVRGIYATRADAEAAIVSRTPSGAVSRAYDAHSEACCGVEEWDVQSQPDYDVRKPDPPVTNSGGFLIPQSLVNTVIASARK